MNKKEKLIVIFTHSNEVNIARVASVLSERGNPYVRIDVDSAVEGKYDLGISEGQSANEPCLHSEKLGLEVRSSEIKSVWYRRPELPQPTSNIFDGWKRDEVDFLRGEYSGFLWSMYTVLGGYWMNRPLYGTHLLEHNKLFQMQIAKRSGLSVPRTILSNNPQQIIAFADACGGKVAVKSIKQRIFTKDDGTNDGIYTNIVTSSELSNNREALSVCPVLLQEYVEKKLELRITVIGNHVFACAIHSQDEKRTMIDWRKYGDKWVLHEEFVLPETIKEKLLASMKLWGIDFGAIDMIVTPGGDYVFLEVNPNGQYGWIEGLTGMPISRTIADVLSDPEA